MPEGFELADEVALAGFGVGGAGEVITAEVGVVTIVGHQVPGDDQDAVAYGEHRPGLALLPERAQQVSVLGGQIAGSGVGGCPGRFAQRGPQRGCWSRSGAGTAAACLILTPQP